MRKENFTIQLTQEKKYNVHLELGRGDFSIGKLGMDSKKFEVLVDENAKLRWTAFEEMSNEGNWWPRYFYYYGNDAGFMEWSKTRAIESFVWYPQKGIKLKSSNLQIRHLILGIDKDIIDLDLEGDISEFSVIGNISNLRVNFGNKVPRLNFSPTLSKDETESYKLPILNNLAKAEYLNISVDVIGQPFDCESILQFSNLTSLSLSGNLTNWSCLSKLDKLKSLAIRFVPDLNDFPSLSVWKNLESFIGWNIEEVEGKRLKKDVKSIVSDKYCNVSQLRRAIWFITEYGMPFAGWEGRNEKYVVKSYKATLKQINKAKSEEEVKVAVVEFIKGINSLSNIETSEREDIGTAVKQLVASAKVEIDDQLANQWFDETRDF